MEYKSEIDQVTAATWHDQMSLFDDANVYQTWSYGAIRWGAKNLSHLVLRRNGEIVAMAQLRIIRSRVAGGVAYLRWGPMCQIARSRAGIGNREADGDGLACGVCQKTPALPADFAECIHWFRKRNGFFPPPSRNSSALRRLPANTDRTFLVDISPSREEIRKKLDQKWRNQLESCGEKTISPSSKATARPSISGSSEVYEKMWSRKQFETTVDVNESCPHP